jgi:TIGR03118 family protein
MHKRRARIAGVCVIAGALSVALVAPVGASTHNSYRQRNLVSDIPGRAQVTDPNLVNAWGVSYTPTSPLWVSDNGTDVATLYAGGVHGGTQTINPLVVNIPGGAPTGQVFNPTSSFVVHGVDGSSAPARFLFVAESGNLSGWNPTVPPPPPSHDAQVAVGTPGAVDKGLAIGGPADAPMLYAADFTAGTVDVYNGTFQRVITAGNFEDGQLPAHYAPFNVAVLNGMVYVSFAEQNGEDELDGAGLGRVDIFTLDGRLVRRLGDHGVLNAPWGMTIAPAGFGEFSGDLLVGNFGDGRIHAFDPTTLALRGVVRRKNNRPVSIDGLWALLPGNGVEGGTDEVIFTAGPGDESHGLLGTLSLRH